MQACARLEPMTLKGFSYWLWCELVEGQFATFITVICFNYQFKEQELETSLVSNLCTSYRKANLNYTGC